MQFAMLGFVGNVSNRRETVSFRVPANDFASTRRATDAAKVNDAGSISRLHPAIPRPINYATSVRFFETLRRYAGSRDKDVGGATCRFDVSSKFSASIFQISTVYCNFLLYIAALRAVSCCTRAGCKCSQSFVSIVVEDAKKLITSVK